MSALAALRRRLALGPGGLRLEALAFGVVSLCLLAALLFAVGGPSPQPAAQVRMQLPPAQAAALIAATAGDSADDVRAFGDDARMINAALPFSGTPVQSARPFSLAGGDLDHKRALLCLTQTVYYEAGFEPLAGRRAVAQVVLNRMRHPAFPKSVCGVVYQVARAPVCQFSFVCDGSLDRRPAAGAWKQSEAVARAALAGHVETSVGSATHYHADYVAPRWAPLLTKITKLGTHIFYRWPGSWGRRDAFTGRYIGEPRDPLMLRPAPSLDGEAPLEQAAAEPDSGPPIARAPSDVGGLLDVSKGWTLNIPGPGDIKGASRTVAQQERPRPATTVAATATPIIASR